MIEQNANGTFKLTDQDIIDSGETREVDIAQIEYLNWLAAGNTPEVISGDRFVVIVDGQPVVNPTKTETLLAEAKAARKESVRANRRAKEAEGVIISGTGIAITIDDRTISRVTALAQLYGAESSETINFKDSSGIFHQIQANASVSILAAMNTAMQSNFDKEKQLYDLIDVCTTTAEVDSVDISF